MSTALRVRHLLSSKKIQLSEFLFTQIELSSERFSELLELGAIYLNQKRCLSDQVLDPGDYVRAHLQPKRFSPLRGDLHSYVVKWEKDFVVFNKPRGYPCHALVDNKKENLQVIFENFFATKFFLTHRLDIGTGGLWLLARTAEFQTEFNRLLQDKKMQKHYWARVEGRWAHDLGLYRHYMKPALRAPREIFDEPQEGFQECLLEVNSMKNQEAEFTDLNIKLLTGRTHQIRSQLSYLGHPVWGDRMYGAKNSLSSGSMEKWHLWAQRLEFTSRTQHWKFILPEEFITAELSS